MNSVHIGERLTQLRAMLAAEALASGAWPRTRLAREAEVSLAALTRLENTGRGSTEVLTAVLHFYQGMGFNMAWVLTPDNADIPLQGFRDIFQDEKLPRARQPLSDLHRLLQPVMAGLDAGQSPSADALRPLLMQVRQGVLHALNHLLPPRRLVLSEADLRAFQRQLPPVRAQSSGWRSASLYTVPYHYYEAGDSLPRCGDPVSYLAYDPGLAEASTLEKTSDSDKCGACKHRLSMASSAAPSDTPGAASR
ncbi:hypothetical protein [Hymenobacter sublimis]|uniref:XRE family transcriptional regulator n=1 Tax=Hymenobacter sublimis TaxID=2933777 RepID=A0ABY4JEZ7_9BACT|nr:hypothetical protein [Hymenobacter sublimis]UPL51398.1 hypothetical protein MWH26_19885 [Hymenobacter sublimis]